MIIDHINLKGKKLLFPYAIDLSIIEDDYVDIEFGTGCLKVTPAHDLNDNEWVRNMKKVIDILNDDASLNKHGYAIMKVKIGL